MLIEIKVPVLPESVADATIAAWHKKEGDSVSRDENLLDLETDKVVLEVPSIENGVLKEILFKAGDVVTAGQVLARISVGEVQKNEPAAAATKEVVQDTNKPSGPAARRLMAENDVKLDDVVGTGSGGRVTKDDV